MNIIERKLRGLVHRRLLPRCVQRFAWNREYANGRWDSISLHTPNDPIYEILAKYCVDRDIYDMGSGHGNTICEMTPIYRTYTGVDISDVALRIATKRATELGRERVRFVQGFMHSYVTEKKVGVFLFRESLMYVCSQRRRVPIDMACFLERFAEMLSENGIMISRLCTSTPDEAYFAAEVEAVVREKFEIIENCISLSPSCQILVFRPVC